MSEQVNRADVPCCEVTGKSASAPSRPVVRRRRVRQLAWLLAFGFLFAAGIYWCRKPLLVGLANAWVIDEPETKADAIVVLGGRPDLRAVEAARLYHEGVAPRILYMDVVLSPSAALGITLSEREQTRRLLLSNNVPEAAMTAIGNGVASTYDEAQALHVWLATNAAHSVLIPTDLFHTRRARWIFARALGESSVEIHLRAIRPAQYGVENWWQHEEGLVNFQNEVIKSVYYRCRY